MTTPLYPIAWLQSTTGQDVETALGDRVAVVTDPSQAHERARAIVLELEVDRCVHTFGVGVCTASGTPCYNTLASCRLRSVYHPGTQTWRFALRGQPVPAGLNWRPYIEGVSLAPTEIKPASGLALRSQTTVTLIDEPDNDAEGDPYRALRAGTPQGTFWGRWVARHPNAINRSARLRRGWWGAPFSDGWFVDERFVIEAVRGPDRDGRVQLVLSDPIKLLDKVQIPAPSGGKLAAALKRVTFSGTLSGAGGSTATLPAGALPDAAAYLDHELVITGNLGAGQRRAVVAYDPVTLTVTLASAWDVVPNSLSTFELLPLKATLGAGEGAQYRAASHVRIGKEIIAIVAVLGDVLYWTSGTSRGAFGSGVEDEHSAGAAVQACQVWQDTPPATVILQLLRATGLDDGQVDVAALLEIEAQWFRGLADITTCISAPAKASELLKELLTDLGLMQWWDAQASTVRTVINLPPRPGTVAALTDNELMLDTVTVERQDGERLSRVGLFYALADATENAGEARNYLRGEVRVDLDAESRNEYRDQRAEVRYSRWLGAANQLHVQALVARRLNALRDAPRRISLSLDPRTAITLGGLVDVTTRHVQGPSGAPETVRARVVKVTDKGPQRDVVVQSTPFGGKRFAWIAPNGQPNYGSATAADKQYAYISASGGGDFADGGGAYRII